MYLSAVWAQLTVNESGTTSIVQVHLTPWVRNKRIEDTTTLRHENVTEGIWSGHAQLLVDKRPTNPLLNARHKQDIIPFQYLEILLRASRSPFFCERFF